MGLRRTRTAPNQRTDAIDFLRTNNSTFANLGFALRHFLLGGVGMHRGGAVRPTTPASMAVLIDPLAALSANNELIVLENQTTRAIAAAHVSLPRIDLVSIRYEELDATVESRWFRDPNPPYSKTQQPIATEIVSSPDTATGIVVTTGTPAASPAAPATPAGYLPLATIAVGAGVTTITADDITRSIVPNPLQVMQFTGPGGTHALGGGPYVMDDRRFRLSTRAGGLSLLFAQLQVNSNNALNVAAMHTRLSISIEEVGGATITEALHRFHVGESKVVWLAGLVVGPKDAVDYRVRFEDLGGSETAWGSVNVTGDYNLFGAISL